MSVVIDANRVTKVFHHLLPRCGSTRVLTDVSFSLHSGEILAVIGPSGAGKTTLVRAVLDQFPLSGGYIHRFGGGRAPRAWRNWIGYEPDAFGMPGYSTGRMFLKTAARVHGLHRESLEKHVREILGALALSAFADTLAWTYSRGIVARFGIAQALVHGPRLVLLDDPAAGLDMNGRCLFKRLLKELRDHGTSVLITSHELTDIESLADRVLVLQAGVMTAYGRPDELMPPETTFTVEVPRDPLLSPGWKFTRYGDQWYSTVAGRAQLDLLLRALRLRGIAPAAVSPVRCAVSSLLSSPA